MMAQEQDLGTESVTVVKNYAPVVLVGPKPILAPLLSDFALPAKAVLSYDILKFPVASAFVPAFGTPKALPVEKPLPSYNSVLQLGLGMRASAEVLYETKQKKSRYEQIEWGLTHSAMAADLPNIPWDSDFFKTQLFAGYRYDKRDTHLYTNLQLKHLANSWYGFGGTNAYSENEKSTSKADLNLAGLSFVYTGVGTDYDLQQSYFGAQGLARLSKDKGVFKNLSMQLHYFGEQTQSSEQRVLALSEWRFPLGNTPMNLAVGATYLHGGFKTNSLRSFEDLVPKAYQFYKFHASPNIHWSKEGVYLNLGAQIVYTNKATETASPLKIYPDIYAHYKLVDKTLLLFGALSGDYLLNSFEEFVNENPFVSPSLEILPTDVRYQAQLGIKGSVGVFSYKASWSEQSANNQALFVANPTNYFRDFDKNFNLGNSFELVYDTLNTQTLAVSLEIAPWSGLKIKGNYSSMQYSLAVEEQAWHLPKNNAELALDYDFSKDFRFQVQWNFMGARAARERQMVQNVVSGPMPSYVFELPAYHSLGLQLNYQLNERLALFLKATNLTDERFELWSGFVAPPRIILAGARYGFDL